MNNQTTDDYVDIKNDIRDGYELDSLMKDERFTNIILSKFVNNTLLNESEGLISDDQSERDKCLEKLKSVRYLIKHLDEIKSASESALNYEE